MRRASAALLVLLLVLPPLSAKESASATARHEIDQLFTVLRESGCAFQRNGRWYDAVEAASHLRRKHDYLVRKGWAASAESLIELAASESSLSGRPYRVKCAGAEAVESRVWFGRQLERIRARTMR